MVVKLNFRIVKCGLLLATNVVKQTVTIVTSLSSRDMVRTTLSKILATPMVVVIVDLLITLNTEAKNPTKEPHKKYPTQMRQKESQRAEKGRYTLSKAGGHNSS